MSVLEEYITLNNTISDLINDSEDIHLIDSIQSSFLDAKRIYNDEKTKFNNEINRLQSIIQKTEEQTKRRESKEDFKIQYQNIQNKHQKTLENISQLQEKRLQLQKDINTIKQSPILLAKQKEIENLQDNISIAEKKLRLYINVFKCFNWDFDSDNIKGFIISDNNTKPFNFDNSTSISSVDSLWELV